jgi:hypothetical protein
VNRIVRAAQVNGEAGNLTTYQFIGHELNVLPPRQSEQSGSAASDNETIDLDAADTLTEAATQPANEGLSSSIHAHAPKTDTTSALKSVAQDVIRILTIKLNVTQDRKRVQHTASEAVRARAGQGIHLNGAR